MCSCGSCCCCNVLVSEPNQNQSTLNSPRTNQLPRSFRLRHDTRPSPRLRHRGPDWSGYEIVTVSEKRRHGIGHERLSIIDPESGAQPLFSRDGQVGKHRLSGSSRQQKPAASKLVPAACRFSRACRRSYCTMFVYAQGDRLACISSAPTKYTHTCKPAATQTHTCNQQTNRMRCSKCFGVVAR